MNRYMIIPETNPKAAPRLENPDLRRSVEVPCVKSANIFEKYAAIRKLMNAQKNTCIFATFLCKRIPLAMANGITNDIIRKKP